MVVPIVREIWKEIPGTDSLYEVSTKGRVRSWRSGPGSRRAKAMMLDQWPNSQGYMRVGVYFGDKRVLARVHRLVAITFIGPIPPRHEVAHKDGNLKNNHVDNLRICTPKVNIADKFVHGTMPIGEKHWNAKLTRIDVDHVRIFLADGWAYWFIAKLFGVSRGTISAIANGRRWDKT